MTRNCSPATELASFPWLDQAEKAPPGCADVGLPGTRIDLESPELRSVPGRVFSSIWYRTVLLLPGCTRPGAVCRIHRHVPAVIGPYRAPG